MRALSAADILQIWELGQNQHPLDRALTLLSFALPEMSREALIHLTIGQRDALLLTLREITLGKTLESFAECPQCRESLEFTLNSTDLKVVDPTLPALPSDPNQPSVPHESYSSQLYRFKMDGFELEFRLPNSRDLAAIVNCENILTAQQQLIQHCIHQASQDGHPIAASQLPAKILTCVGEQVTHHDPQAEMLLQLTCPACQHSWQVLFDIVTFFWSELNAQAKRLLQEIHTLARFYGWRESDILSMSPMRRQFYLSLVAG
jgi:hypothetical protein